MSYDPAINLTRYPLAMSEYGSNPFGEDLYRIVYSASVRHLVGGKWSDNGACEYRWTPTYDFEGWVLERWHTAWQFAQMGQPEWDRTYLDPASGFLTLGPYPSRGVYVMAHRFVCPVADCNIGKLVRWIEQSQKNSWQDIRDANRDAYEREEKSRDANLLDAVSETRRAHGHRPMVGRYAKYGSKTAPETLTADQLRMPRPKAGQPHKFVMKGR